MNDRLRLFDTNILVHAYTVSDKEKHRVARALVEEVWKGDQAATTLQNLCEFFFVVTGRVEKPMAAAVAEPVVRGLAAVPRNKDLTGHLRASKLQKCR